MKFFHDELCLWHGGGHYSQMMKTEGLVQPGGGWPENPETKRRLVNLMRVTGLMSDLQEGSAPPATRDDLLRVHPAEYLDRFKALSDEGPGEFGHAVPFLKGGYEIAALSAGLTKAALLSVLRGDTTRAYALSRPPGHHALPDRANGFCFFSNIAVAIHAAKAAGLATRFAVLDWDVHHGNGTEAIFIDDPDVLTISIHQDRDYPLDTGGAEVRGAGNANINIPLPPGCGEVSYLEALTRIVAPSIRRFAPEVIIIASGYDASAFDPLGRMLLSGESFGKMGAIICALADEVCDGRLIATHEGGYSEAHVPFCGHALIAEMAGSSIRAPDPLGATITARQPGPPWIGHVSTYISELSKHFEV